MKTDRLFRSFTPYNIICEGVTPFERLTMGIDAMDIEQGYIAADPTGQMWGTVGLLELSHGDYFDDLDGSGFMLMIQFAKRQLPVRVIRIEADKLAARVFEQTGRKPGRKEYRELMEDATATLLPKSHINYSKVAVIVRKEAIYVFNTATNNLDVITSFLKQFFQGYGVDFGLESPMIGATSMPLSSYMTSKAIEQADSEYEGDSVISATDFAVMKAQDESKGSVRVANHNLAAEDVQKTIRLGFAIGEMGVYDSKNLISYRLSNEFRFRQVEVSDDIALDYFENQSDEDAAIDNHATAWFVNTQFSALLETLLADINGYEPEEEM